MEIRTLCKDDYDELLSVLNTSFATVRNRPVDFLCGQPKMWVRDDAHMARHIGLFEDGRLAAVVGIYPLTLHVGGEVLRFATTGNVATLPEYAGRGYFSKLFALAMERAEKEGYDGLRLGGQKQRYGRYGFENCGALYSVTFSEKNRAAFPEADYENIVFEKLERDSLADLRYARELSEKMPCFVERSPEENERDTYLVLRTRYSEAYIAKRGGIPCGYLSAAEGGKVISELRAENAKAFFAIACAWQRKTSEALTLPIAPWMKEELAIAASTAESINVCTPSKFKILRPERVIHAFMKLRHSLAPMQKGELILAIEGHGALRLAADETRALCEKIADRKPDLSLDAKSAAQMLFGPLPASVFAALPPHALSWFPLPLCWNFLDVV